MGVCVCTNVKKLKARAWEAMPNKSFYYVHSFQCFVCCIQGECLTTLNSIELFLFPICLCWYVRVEISAVYFHKYLYNTRHQAWKVSTRKSYVYSNVVRTYINAQNIWKKWFIFDETRVNLIRYWQIWISTRYYHCS